MSDYAIHSICAANETLQSYVQTADLIIGCSGKIMTLLKLLKKTKQEGRRTLVFSQFTSLLDIIQEVGLKFVLFFSHLF
jgi:SNF2 family DNA or RNA helicase